MMETAIDAQNETDLGRGIDDSASTLQRVSTVDRRLVHRTALAEVFLTDARVSGRGYVVAAQLPRRHSYYGDDVASGRRPDPLLLLECCRQAETLGAHRFHGVPLETKFVLSGWSLDVVADAIPLLDAPVHLTLEVDTANAVRRGGALQRQEYRFRLWWEGTPLAEAWMDVAYLPPALYGRLRERGRGAPPPLSGALPPENGDGVPAATVGRADQGNVVVSDLRYRQGGASAALRLLTGHASMFDHPLDHVPGMVLTEAARQLALLTGATRTPASTGITHLDARFHRHTELDAPVTLCADRAQTGNGQQADDPAVRVQVEQAGVITAELSVHLADEAASGIAPALTGRQDGTR
jgi:hypothetical protein